MLLDMLLTPWKHYNAAEQQKKQVNKAMRQTTNVIKRARKNGCCKSLAKYITEILNPEKTLNEHKLETNTRACK